MKNNHLIRLSYKRSPETFKVCLLVGDPLQTNVMFQLQFETGQQSMWGKLLSMVPKGGSKESKETDQAFSGLKQIKRMQKCQM